MPTLTAIFRLVISSPCRMTMPDGETPCIQATVGNLNVIAKLHNGKSSRTKFRDDQNWTTDLEEMEVIVSRNESDEPPDLVVMPDGTRDLVMQGKYLQKHLPEYGAAAREIANRVLKYFRFALLTPKVQLISTWDNSLHNPTWYDAAGHVLRGHHNAVLPPEPGLHGELGAMKLVPAQVPDLQAFVVSPSEPSLVDSLLSDAQTAWFEGELRRAVLELAIGTEIMVKRRIFSEATPAGAAFDYLEDKSKVSVSVPDLIGAVSEIAFGKNYMKDERHNYDLIVNLFRCRNKIAHRGALVFRDEATKSMVTADAPMVESWWHAVSHLNRWLNA